MTKHIDLGAETVAFVRMRMVEEIGEDPENLKRVELNMKEVKEQIFRLFYDYQVVHGWPHVAANTADVLGFDERTVRRLQKKTYVEYVSDKMSVEFVKNAVLLSSKTRV